MLRVVPLREPPKRSEPEEEQSDQSISKSLASHQLRLSVNLGIGRRCVSSHVLIDPPSPQSHWLALEQLVALALVLLKMGIAWGEIPG